MKTMKKIFAVMCVVLLCTSCLNDFLDVEPVSDISTSIFWKTGEDARAGLNSIYADFLLNFNRNSGGNYMSWYEGRSDNFVGASTSSDGMPMKLVNTNNLNSVHPSTNWNTWYKSVSTANYAIHFIPQIKNLSEQEKNNYMAEAHFLRAFCYFNLMRIWSDVPLITEPTLSLEEVSKPTQSSQEVILEQIKNDLETAVGLINYMGLSTELHTFSPAALYCLYAHYAMWVHDYGTAEKYTGLVLAQKYSLVSGAEFATVCSKATTSENIWTLKWLFENNGKNNAIYKMNGMNAPQLIPSKGIREAWQSGDYADDLRGSQTLNKALVYTDSHITDFPKGAAIWKWEPGVGVAETNEKYIPVYRLGEIMLLRAEALNQLKRPDDALKLLSDIRKRAGLTEKKITDYEGLSGDDLIYAIESDILLERQMELIGEGHRWFDLIRTGRAKQVMNDYFENYLKLYDATITYKKFEHDWQLYSPVLYDNILDNANLKQFGGY